MQFSELLNQPILMTIPKMHPTKYQTVKVVGVESGGLWIECQEITNRVLQMAGAPSAPRTIVVFLPYHSIGEVAHFVDGPSLNEKSFGV